ncbi:MAG: ZrgA family zinc uptake protein [Pseudomonadales bacterium]|jgi:hypothetical protein
MKTSNPMTMALASLMLTLPSHHAIASELDAHEHGSASLDIAIDTNTIEMKFESPAVNIVGFEYATEDQQQLLLIKQAKKNLSDFDTIFQLVGDVSCQTVESSANWVTEHEEGHEEGHDDHEADHDDHEADHDDHGEVAKAEHAEFIAEYRLECNQLNNLAAIDVNMFKFFPGIADLDVQVIYSEGQIKQELDVNNTRIKLGN